MITERIHIGPAALALSHPKMRQRIEDKSSYRRAEQLVIVFW